MKRLFYFIALCSLLVSCSEKESPSNPIDAFIGTWIISGESTIDAYVYNPKISKGTSDHYTHDFYDKELYVKDNSDGTVTISGHLPTCKAIISKNGKKLITQPSTLNLIDDGTLLYKGVEFVIKSDYTQFSLNDDKSITIGCKQSAYGVNPVNNATITVTIISSSTGYKK